MFIPIEGEFYGEFKNLLLNEKIKQIFTKSIHKAAVVERLNRTLKERMFRLFTYQKTNNYIKILNQLINSYNNSYHSSIKMKPNQVTKSNRELVFNNLYGDQFSIKNPIKIEFKTGEYVRIVVDKTVFEKGYTPNWSNEIYLVDIILPSNPPRYKLKTLSDEKLNERFYYKQELQKVNYEEFPFDTFKVIEQNKNKIKVQKLNYPEKEPHWIDKNE